MVWVHQIVTGLTENVKNIVIIKTSRSKLKRYVLIQHSYGILCVCFAYFGIVSKYFWLTHYIMDAAISKYKTYTTECDDNPIGCFNK